MKKLLLASAIAALSITAVQAAPTVYGKAFLTLDIQDGDNASPSKDSRSQLNSVGSRIGLKGSEALTSNTDLIYQLEYRLDIDDDADESIGGTNFEARDTYIGFNNKEFGTVVAGRLTAIDDYINYAKVVSGGVVGGDDVLANFSGGRANNAFAYFSPNYQGVQLMGMYALDELKTDSMAGAKQNDSFGRDAWGLGAKYEPSNLPVKAGATYIQAGDDLKVGRISGVYAINQALTLGAQYQLASSSVSNSVTRVVGKDKENVFTVSGSYKVPQTPWTAYAQVDYTANADYVKDDKEQRVAVGGKYEFNKATTGHVYGAFMNTEKYNTVSSARVDADSYGIGAGLEYKF